jgi:hypothetical protein
MASDGEHAHSGGDAEVEGTEEEKLVLLRLLRMLARKKKARPRAPSGRLRPVRRRAALMLAGGGGGRRLKEFLLWRERCIGEQRQSRETARWSGVRAPPNSHVPVFLEVERANNEIVLHPV